MLPKEAIQQLAYAMNFPLDDGTLLFVERCMLEQDREHAVKLAAFTPCSPMIQRPQLFWVVRTRTGVFVKTHAMFTAQRHSDPCWDHKNWQPVFAISIDAAREFAQQLFDVFTVWPIPRDNLLDYTVTHHD
jgi:hypothetical protein